jgi:patatin-like phospholipase/acyl hydrolase
VSTPTPHPKQNGTRPKRLLALDGGGIRGMISLEMLAEIERIVKERTNATCLGDYFDYVGGTSTGAIIATCISLGMSVEQIKGFYHENGRGMFDKVGLFERLKTKFTDENLAKKLREVFNQFRPEAERLDKNGKERDITLGSAALKTLLLVVMRNVTTDSPWPISNNPFAKYNDRGRDDCNLDLPLWQLVRASTAAPTYFPPETVRIGSRDFVFVDGGVTMYNNPAFLLFLMATVAPYKCEWKTGADDMLLVSVGTGAAADANDKLRAGDLNLICNASHIPGALMYGALNEQDTLARVFGRCRYGANLDREIGDLRDLNDAGPHLTKHFTYVRYNAELSESGLQELGLPHIKPTDVQQMDTIDHMSELAEVGEAAAKQIDPKHFDDFVA